MEKVRKTKFKEDNIMLKMVKRYFENNLEVIAMGLAVASGNDIRVYID